MRGKLGPVVAAVSLGVILAWAAPAFAYGPGGAPTVNSTSSSTTPGGSLVVSGANFDPDEGITITLHSAPVTLATTTDGASGSFSVTVTIPTDIAPGTHTIIATDASGDSASTTLVVTGPTPSPATATATSGLAFTGADIAALSGVGALALALGGMLLIVSRRRRIAE